MKKRGKSGPTHSPGIGRNCPAAQMGFSLVELLVAVAIFSIVSAVAFSLFTQQLTSGNQVQGQAALNIGLRNAISLMQMDLANAGSGMVAGANIPSWPVGVTFSLPPAGTCYTPGSSPTYGAPCFDTLNIIAAANPATYPPINATDSSGGALLTNCSFTSAGVAYGRTALGLTLAQTAAKFSNLDQLLFVSSNGRSITTVILTSNATVAGSAVKFSFNSTTTGGVNAADPLKIATAAITNTVLNDTWTDTTAYSDQLTNQFCGADWIIKLAPVVYTVDTTTANDPKLVRTQNGTTSTVMEQVIGFKVGASVWNDGSGGTGTTYSPYYYDPGLFPSHSNDFSLARSIRISLIARTVPVSNPTYKFRNNFDNGPYQIQGASVVASPRNMTMND